VLNEKEAIVLKELTTTDLLSSSIGDTQLTEFDRQRRFAARMLAIKQPCPHCNTTISYVDAAGGPALVDLDQPARSVVSCPQCERRLRYVLPFVSMGPLWEWEPDDAT
jgi:uncharacterized protein with PIN domain